MVTNSAPHAPAPSAVEALRCSVCGASLHVTGRSLRCDEGHAFDIAKQGYVNLLHARVPSGTADSAEMVAARAEFLDAGHFAPLAEAIAGVAKAAVPGAALILDAGGGTGYYLAKVLDALPGATGLSLDLSAVASRRAARAHARASAAVWNLWHPLPLAGGCASLVLNVFAPRNGAEFRRVLREGGRLVVVTPTPEHLAELAELTRLLDVDPDKPRRVAAALNPHFTEATSEAVDFSLELTAAEVRSLIGMGPTAHHLRPGAFESLPATVRVTASCTVAVYEPRSAAA
ncbi:MAG: hypothetical protein GEU86_03805 [Actinophytocola sp.]|nr:hypothetical protein [Actinophytocola sp.]